jgi:hypothetical protein
VLALWDSPRQREAYTWFTVELANLRAAFRWAADHDDLDTAAAIAANAAFLGYWVEQYEPSGWAEELVESAKAVDHRRLPQLYAMAAQCYLAGRSEDFLGYVEAGQIVIETGRFDAVPYDFEAMLGSAYMALGQPERWVEVCRTVIARSPGTHTLARALLVVALTFADAHDEALAASEGLPAAADNAGNPHAASFALLGYGFARRDADPVAAHAPLQRGLTIAQDSGNRQAESILASVLSRWAVVHGDPTEAFDYMTLAIRNYYDSGNIVVLPSPLAALAALLDRLGHHEPAATISGFAATPFTRRAHPGNTTITHLREVLGDEAYESFARAGLDMTNARMVTYALDQIDQARADLNPVLK